MIIWRWPLLPTPHLIYFSRKDLLLFVTRLNDFFQVSHDLFLLKPGDVAECLPLNLPIHSGPNTGAWKKRLILSNCCSVLAYLKKCFSQYFLAWSGRYCWVSPLNSSLNSDPNTGACWRTRPFNIIVVLSSHTSSGYAYDRSEGSLLSKFAPERLHLATTSGPQATGDGVRLGQAAGAALVDMDQIQVKPPRPMVLCLFHGLMDCQGKTTSVICFDRVVGWWFSVPVVERLSSENGGGQLKSSWQNLSCEIQMVGNPIIATATPVAPVM